jgi:hypothetical protein
MSDDPDVLSTKTFTWQREGGKPHPVVVEEFAQGLVLGTTDNSSPPGWGGQTAASMKGKSMANFVDTYITNKSAFRNGKFTQGGYRRRKTSHRKSKRHHTRRRR